MDSPRHPPTQNFQHKWRARGGRALELAALLSSQGAQGTSCSGGPGRGRFTSPGSACSRLRSDLRLQQCRPARCRQSPAPSPLGSVSELSYMCIYIYASHATALLCAARPLPLDWLGRSLRDNRLRRQESSRETHIGQVFKLQREESEYLGGLRIPQGGASRRTGRWVPSLCPRSGSSLRTPEPFAPSAPRS